jgi:hypothetical protein
MYRKILTLLGYLGAVVGGLLLQSIAAQATIVGYDWGGCPSTTPFMDSHRAQRHSFQTTVDGGIHILINTGSTTGNALQICSSFNGGITWVSTYTFTGTSSQSSDDVAIGTPGPNGTPLQVVYDMYATGTLSALMYAVLLYNNGGWTVQNSEIVASVAGMEYFEPAFAVDAENNIWVAASQLNTATGNQVVTLHYQAANSTTWSSTGVGLPNPNSGQGINGIEHGPRPVYVPSSVGNIGLLYQSYNCLYWVTINGSVVSPLTVVSCNLPVSQEQVNDTAFSVVTDSLGDQYLGYVTNGPAGTTATLVVTQVYYPGTGWDIALAQGLSGDTSPGSAIYVKMSLVTVGSQTSVYAFVNNQGALALYEWGLGQSACGGPSYCLANNFTHAPANQANGQSFGNPRIDVPAYFNSQVSGSLYVFEQYNNTSTTFSFMFWAIPL